MQTVSVDFPRDLINIFKVREKDISKVVRETLSSELYREGHEVIVLSDSGPLIALSKINDEILGLFDD